MPRVKRSTKRSDRRKKILKRASGYFLTKSKLYQAAQEAVERGLKFAYTGRRLKKRQFRSLWIVRITAACKLNGTSYSPFINGLKIARNPRVSGPLCVCASRYSPRNPFTAFCHISGWSSKFMCPALGKITSFDP